MIDPADKQTQALPLEQPKRGRGRPATGAALTPAQKQKAYRERQKQLLAEAHNLDAISRVQEGLNAEAESQISFLRKLLDEERENCERLANKVIGLERQLKELNKSNVTEKPIKGLKKQLAQRDEKPEKTYVCAIQKKSPKGQWRTVCKYETHMEGNTAYLEVCEGEMAHLYRIINLK